MRRLLLIALLACLAVPAAAVAQKRAPGDGSLVVRSGAGFLRLDITGAVIGRLEAGQVEIASHRVDDCDDWAVWGADRARIRSRTGVTTCTFTVFLRTPQAIRFRVVLGPDETLTIRGASSLSVSAVGQGSGFIRGAGAADGVYSLHAGAFRSLPDLGLAFSLGATLP
ncbi:MAG: hypothetical protein ICV67_00700 [Thermoleophilia bacterium]|nr:hypothetical protein [Thermoleophilia bacterium]